MPLTFICEYSSGIRGAKKNAQIAYVPRELRAAVTLSVNERMVSTMLLSKSKLINHLRLPWQNTDATAATGMSVSDLAAGWSLVA